MPLETTYTQARASFASLCNAASDDREVVIIHRRNAADVVLIAADELSSLLETAHLLRSPRNAERLLDLVEAVLRDPFSGIGKPEPLKYLGAESGRAG